MADFYAARSGTIPPLPWTNFAPPLSHIRRATKAGWIAARKRKCGGKKWSSTIYQATLPPSFKREAIDDTGNASDRNLNRTGEETSSSAVRNQVPTNTPNNNPINTGRSAISLPEADFDVVWDNFPRNPESRKSAGFIEWEKLTPDERIHCLGAVADFAIAFNDRQSHAPSSIDPLTFAPHLSNWLKDRKWAR